MAEIFFAGGCFWGVEKLFAGIRGVTATECGYANGYNLIIPDYMTVCSGKFGFREAVKVEYDPGRIELAHLLDAFFAVIDPMVENRQGHDVGKQYQAGIYWTDAASEDTVKKYIDRVKGTYPEFKVEIGPLTYYVPAEEYHQKYLDKNPGGYCHISAGDMEKIWRE